VASVLTIRIPELSLRQRLLLLTLLTSGVGLLSGCIAYFAYDLHVASSLRAEIDRLTSPKSILENPAMNYSNDSASLPGVNFPELLARVENDRELLRDLLLIFKEDFPRHFQALQEAVSRGDSAQVSAVSHTLKGMLSNLSATRAAACAAALEHIGRAKDTPSFAKALVAFEHETLCLIPEMDTYLLEVQHEDSHSR
jgi:HPt (histidine-containing phosphotransfer) domain-containing protein